jgi:uncharacterized protein (TIGR04255 family)
MDTEALKKLNKPSFKKPPVVEVVASIQFNEPNIFEMRQFKDIWDRLDHKKYSKYAEMPPLERITDGKSQVIKFSNFPGLRRVWLEDENNNKLIQLQEDRLILNWRHPNVNIKTDCIYPRYENIIEEFFSIFDVFQKYLSEKQNRLSNPDLLELTYVNFIEVDGNEIENVNSIFKDFNWVIQDRILNTPTFIDQKLIYDIPDMASQLKCTIRSHQSPENGCDGILYELSVRGGINEIETSVMRTWYDNARLWIVNSFKDSTHEDMHKVWGLENE